MKKKRVSFLIVTLLIIILFSNFIPHVQIGERFVFVTDDLEIVDECMPSKGYTVKVMEKSFEELKQKNPKFKDKQLYRTFKMEFWRFWNWRRYLTNPLYKYPFLDISKIQKSDERK